MANREVNLTKRVLVEGQYRNCPPVYSDNGRIKQDWVLVNGQPEHLKEGNYWLRWREGENHIRISVGKNAADAVARKLRQEQVLRTKALGVEVVEPESSDSSSLARSIREYLADIKLTKKAKTHAAYQRSLELFSESCRKPRVENINRRDMLQFAAFLRSEKELEPRTVWNKFSNVMSFLKAQGVRNLVTKNDWPKFTEDEPEVYEEEHLKPFFDACDEEERLWFKFFLQTGMREQEVMHVSWADISLSQAIVTVRYKAEYGFSPKAYKGREIPIPDTLVLRLKEHKAKADKTCGLVFPTSGCKPKLNFLDDCKAVAERAKLDPSEYWLHKFRATFATWALWKGTDLRTVQQWLGHSDIESTMRYLKPSRSQATRDKVNEIFAD
ncbi:MAG: site-specific integrase [Candidatus Sulfotelmatobacter sp.]|jgi:integrase